jgi:uracil-DNA glycosylase family protein
MAEAQALPPITTLAALREAEIACIRCPLYRDATQVVPGEGPATARLMLVGEQPGDQEDLQGRPFVGPAGRVLDRAMSDAGIERSEAFVTNAVKHFKWEPRGKRRLHKKPSAYEIDRCRWWNDLERAIIRPELTVALGVTAAVSLLGRSVTISRVRGTLLQGRGGGRIVVTVHPSYLLRLTDAADKAREYDRFVVDLRLCAEHLRAAA